MRTLPRAACLVLAAALSLAVVPASPAAAAPGVNPANVELTLAAGESQTIAATVTTPPIAPRPDIVFLADTTGSMQPALANVSQNIRRIVTEVKAAQPEAQFAVTEYKEERNTRAFHVNTPLTNDENSVANGVQDWLINVGGGGAPWTDFINAHWRIGTDAIAFRPNTTRIVAWFGDARSHDPSMGHTLQDAIVALQVQGVRVVAVPLDGTGGGGLDALGQASAITSATRGELLPPTATNAIAQGLVDGIHALDVTVAPTVTSCDPALTVGFSPTTLTVPSGVDASFQETIGVREATAPGTYGCTVDFRTGGVSAGYTQSITVHVPGQGPTLSVDDVRVTEGDTGTASATFTVRLDRASEAGVSVRYVTADGSATVSGGDYRESSGQVTIPAGSTSGTFSVPVVGDTVVEPDETFTVQLSAAMGATIADGQGVGTIVNDDVEVPPSRLSIGDVSVVEGGSGTANAVFTVSLDGGPATQPVTVHYATADGTAASPSDFTAVAGDLTIPAGVASVTVGVPIVGDTVVEPDETFTVELSDPVNATIVDGSGVGTIRNDDVEVPPVGVSVGDVSVVEGGTGTTPAAFVVRLEEASTRPVTVHYATADGTATAPGDFVASSGEVVFAPGETTQQVVVPVVGDTVVEPDETFTVQLTDPTNATIVDGSGVGTIQDDDERPALSVGDVTVDESAGAATFTVTLDRTSANPATVRFATTNDTATAPADFANTTGDLTFAPGQTAKQITVPIVSDAVDEQDETFTVNLSSPELATLADPTGVGTIRDDDRDGVFACRASTLTVVANPPYAPCADDAKSTTSLNVNVGLLRVQANGPRAATDQTPDNLAGTRPAATDNATSTAQLGSTKITALGLTIELGAITSTATASCRPTTTGFASSYRGASSIGSVKVNGIAIPVGSQPVTVPLLLGTLKLNSTTTTATGVTQRAVELQSLLGNVVLGEARAGSTGTPAHPAGNPCMG